MKLRGSLVLAHTNTTTRSVGSFEAVRLEVVRLAPPLHFFLPRRFGITFFEKSADVKNCERKRQPNGGIGWVGGARLRISGGILGL